MKKSDLSKIKHHYAAILLVTEDGKLIGQHRDAKPGIDNPGEVGMFGGTIEPGETPLSAAWRELVGEETNLRLDKTAIVPYFEEVGWREMTSEWEVRHFFYAKISNEQLDKLEVYEGQGWSEIMGPKDTNFVEVLRPAINKFLKLSV